MLLSFLEFSFKVLCWSQQFINLNFVLIMICCELTYFLWMLFITKTIHCHRYDRWVNLEFGVLFLKLYKFKYSWKLSTRSFFSCYLLLRISHKHFHTPQFKLFSYTNKIALEFKNNRKSLLNRNILIPNNFTDIVVSMRQPELQINQLKIILLIIAFCINSLISLVKTIFINETFFYVTICFRLKCEM